MQKVDHITVKALEGKAPRASVSDFTSLYRQMQKGELFSAFSEQERNAVWDTLQSVDGLIPSLLTFFNDFKSLQVWSRCAKVLKIVPLRGTVFTALKQSFNETNQQMNSCVIQEAESIFTVKLRNMINPVDLGYRQLFLYTMRHHREMIPGSTKIELKGKKKMAEGIKMPKEVDKLA